MYSEETNRKIKEIESKSVGCDFKFALMTDSRLCENFPNICKSIKDIDKAVEYDCIVHLGNVVLGNNPENITNDIYKAEADMLSDCVQNGKLYLTQGKTDGYRNERFTGQLAINIVSDEKWADKTRFITEYDNVTRPENKPYYYADFEEKKVRLIFLCSYYSQLDEEDGLYEKYVRLDVPQQKWLKNTLMNTEAGWTVILFSHALPKSRFETGSDPFVYVGFSTEPVLRIIQEAVFSGVNIAGWFAGAYNKDEVIKVADINHVIIDSLATNKNKIDTGANIKESWDSVLVNTKERYAELVRFGYGENRKIEY